MWSSLFWIHSLHQWYQQKLKTEVQNLGFKLNHFHQLSTRWECRLKYGGIKHLKTDIMNVSIQNVQQRPQRHKQPVIINLNVKRNKLYT